MSHDCLYERELGAISAHMENMDKTIGRVEVTLGEVRDETMLQRGEINALTEIVKNGSNPGNHWGRGKKIVAGGSIVAVTTFLGYLVHLLARVLEVLS